jgi:aldose 1-epimerase
MPIQTRNFGRIHQQDITEYTLFNSGGMSLAILDYGGIITRMLVPGKDDIADIVLGFDTLEEYLNNTAYIGAIVGRFANRIAGGRFQLDDTDIQLDINTPPHHLHGGFHGFDRCTWKAEPFSDNRDLCLQLYRLSPDGEGGYPGNLEITVIYRLTENNVLSFEVSAITDKTTPVSITQHSYFNLRGHDTGNITPLHLQLMADAVTETDAQNIPTGNVLPVNGTAYDFQHATHFGTAQVKMPTGFDINYRIIDNPGILRPAAILYDPRSGRVMTVATTLPGIQLYDGTFLTETSMQGKNNSVYSQCAGLCLETQHYPDAVNQPNFPSAILRPGEQYNHQTTYTFTLDY